MTSELSETEGAVCVRMPSVEVGMTEAVLGQILVSVGDRVQRGQALFDVEADKIDLAIDSPVAGTVSRILRQPGDEVAVGDEVLWIDTAG